MKPFDSIIDDHGAVVLRVCRALLQPADAEDAWSETFLAAFRAYPQLASETNIRGWLVTIAHHKAIDVLRSASRQTLLVEDIAERSPSSRVSLATQSLEPFESPIDFDSLRAAIGTLPEKQRRAVAYRYLGELNYAEIGTLLECSQSAARRSVSDGLAALRKTKHTYDHSSKYPSKGNSDDTIK
jgi:RNA polymerase sigma factor (sigma-70 family)